LQLRASPQTVRLAVRTASPGADATNVLVTVPQPMPGKQVPGGAGDTVGAAVGATIEGAELVAGDQYVLCRTTLIVAPTLTATVSPRLSSVSSVVSGPVDGLAGTDAAGLAAAADGVTIPGVAVGFDSEPVDEPPAVQPPTRPTAATRTAMNLACRLP
jgi:hypothetical protein